MNFELNDEQRQLADSVARYLNDRYDFDSRKKIIQSDSGLSDTVWGQLAEMGLLSIPFSEDAGGFGGGAVDLMSAMQSAGAALLIEPLLPNVVAGRLVDRLGSAAQKTAYLSPLMEGASRLAFACGEDGSRYQLDTVDDPRHADQHWLDAAGLEACGVWRPQRAALHRVRCDRHGRLVAVRGASRRPWCTPERLPQHGQPARCRRAARRGGSGR